MAGSLIAVILLFILLAILAYLRRRPPEMSESGTKWFRRGLILLSVSAIALAAEFLILLNIDNANFNHWRGKVGWIAILDFCVNGAALACFLSVLWTLLPFTHRDASDVTPAGIILGMLTLFMQAAWFFLCVLCIFVP